MLNIALLVRHQNFLHPKNGNLQEVSRESVHFYTKIAKPRRSRRNGPVLNESNGRMSAAGWNGDPQNIEMSDRIAGVEVAIGVLSASLLSPNTDAQVVTGKAESTPESRT